MGGANQLKVLFISAASGPDYLCDCAFHGLRTLLGPDCVDDARLAYMYRGYETKNLYGKGFTLYGLLDEGSVDRTDTLAKIRKRYFDLIVFGSIHRDHRYLFDIMEHYRQNEIVFLDGEDQPLFLSDCVHHGMYFKRELYTPQYKVFPIQFGIPEEKLVGASRKSTFMAPLDPFNPRTYIYSDESAYYHDYQKSLFGKTMKKAGWDCMRHYEIMASECVPYFENIEYCPPTIMVDLPKEELVFAKTLVDYKGFNVFELSAGKELWSNLNERIQRVLREKLTTVALARYILDTARKEGCQWQTPIPRTGITQLSTPPEPLSAPETSLSSQPQEAEVGML